MKPVVFKISKQCKQSNIISLYISERYALVIGNPHHPHPGEAWGICGGNRGLDFSLCPMGWGLRSVSSIEFTDVKY